VTARIHDHACVADEEGKNHDGEEEYVPGEGEKYKKAHTAKKLTGAAILILVIVVAPTATAAGGPARDGRLAANSRLFAFDLRRSGGKN
jgi:hypothetical protein